MTNVKVTYGSTVRRLNITSTTSWSEVETQLRNLFGIPKEIPTTVSYTDEDGDIITLSSDLELQEVLSSNNNNSSIKFVLTTSNNNNRERSIDTVIDEETSNLINGVSSIQIEESKESETPGENSKNASKSTNNNNDNNNDNNTQEENNNNFSDDEPDIIVIITRNPWSHRRRERFGGCNPYYSPYYGRSHHGYYSNESQRGCNTGGCNRSGSSRGYGCGRYYRRNQQISPEVVTEKINTLNSMGFSNDNLEELVKEHNGNLETVLEALLFNQQNEQNNEKGGEENGQSMEIEEENKPYVL